VDSYYENANVRGGIDALLQLAQQNRKQITDREYKHVQALHRMSKMEWSRAADIWDDVLLESPTDIHAIKMAFFMRFFTGERDKQLQLVEQCHAHFQSNRALNSE